MNGAPNYERSKNRENYQKMAFQRRWASKGRSILGRRLQFLCNVQKLKAIGALASLSHVDSTATDGRIVSIS